MADNEQSLDAAISNIKNCLRLNKTFNDTSLANFKNKHKEISRV